MKRTRGNLLEADVEALVNTVNTVGVMGKGIASSLRRHFQTTLRPTSGNSTLDVWKSGGLRLSSWRHHKPTVHHQFSHEKHWRERSRIEFIREGLKSLVEAIRTFNISSIAIPPLGCGNGGLHWDEVRPLIEEAMAQVPDVRALVYEPAGTPPAAQMVNRTERPKPTPGRAAMLGGAVTI